MLPVIVLVTGNQGDKGVVLETPRDEIFSFDFHTQILISELGFSFDLAFGTTSLHFTVKRSYSCRFSISCKHVLP